MTVSQLTLYNAPIPLPDRPQLRQERHFCRDQKQRGSSPVVGGIFTDHHSSAIHIRGRAQLSQSAICNWAVLNRPSDRAQLRQERHLCRDQKQTKPSPVRSGRFTETHSPSEKGLVPQNGRVFTLTGLWAGRPSLGG